MPTSYPGKILWCFRLKEVIKLIINKMMSIAKKKMLVVVSNAMFKPTFLMVT